MKKQDNPYNPITEPASHRWYNEKPVKVEQPKPGMNYEAIQKKIDKFFEEVDPTDIVRMFEERGYEFEAVKAKQVAKTVEDILDKGFVAQTGYDSQDVVVLRSDAINAIEAVKQQYQQELIEKLEAEEKTYFGREAMGIRVAIELIKQS